jgi:hypothetical protein
MDFEEKTEARFKLGACLAERFLAQKPGANLTPGADVTFEAAMLFFFCKSYKTYQAIAVCGVRVSTRMRGCSLEPCLKSGCKQPI